MNIDNFMEVFPQVTANEKLSLLKMMKEDTSISRADKKKFYDRLDSDTAYFARCFLGHIVTEVPDFHKEIYDGMDSLNDEQRFFAGVLFRGAAKSTIKNIFVIKSACHQRHPFIMMISETEDQATLDLVGISEEFECNELIRYFYFNNRDTKGSSWNRSSIELSNGVAIYAKGMNSRIRGSKHKNQRPTLVIMDDFESRNSLATVDTRKIVFSTVDETILPMGDIGCHFIFLNTIVSPLAYMQDQINLRNKGCGLFCEPTGKLVFKCLTYKDLNGIEHATWIKRFPMPEVNRLRKIFMEKNSMPSFYQEYYNVPKEESNPKFNVSLIQPMNGKFVKRKYVKYIEVDGKKIPVNTFQGIDPAVRLHDLADDTCMFVIGVDKNSNVYLIDIIAGKIEETKKPIKILDQAELYKIDSGTIETFGAHFSLYAYTQKAMRELNRYFLYHEFGRSKSGKGVKYKEGLEPLINSGKVSFLTSCPSIDIMKEQMSKFSGGKTEHDDLIDGFYLANVHAYPCTMGPEMVDYFIQKEEDEAKNNSKKYDDDYLNWRTA